MSSQLRRAVACVSILMLALSLTACGGGGSNSTSSSPVANNGDNSNITSPGTGNDGDGDGSGNSNPTSPGTGDTGGNDGGWAIDVGPDQMVIGRQAVTVTVTSDATSPTYQWSFASKPNDSALTLGDIKGADTGAATFTPDVVGDYILKVVVTADGTTLTDSVTVTADEIWRALADANLSGGRADFTSLAVAPDGTPYVAYSDHTNSNKATVLAFDRANNAWVGLGGAGFSAGQADYTSLAVARDGTAYLAYKDGGNSGKATVMKYDDADATWVNVGSPGFSAGAVTATSLAISPDGTPYIAYQDGGNGDKAVVMKYDGANVTWVNVGNPGFSAGAVTAISLAIAPDGTPYVAYQDGGNGDKVVVEKYGASGWFEVGNATASAAAASNTTLAIAPDGTPYVAYADSAEDLKATVMKYNSTSDVWVAVGQAGFSAGAITATSLVIAPDGTPYFACQDGGNGDKATVMKYDDTSGAWADVGRAGLSPGEAGFTSVAAAPDGTPILAYSDGANGGEVTIERLSTIAPQVVRIQPGAGVSQSARTSDPDRGDATIPISISVTFDRPMDVSTLTNSTAFRVTDNDGPVTATMTYDAATYTETVHPTLTYPDSPLKGDVTVKLTDAIDDLAGHAFRGMSWMFHVPFWESVGNHGFSAGEATYISLAIGSDSTPYIAFSDYSLNNKVTAMKYNDGTGSWVNLGSPGFSPGGVKDVSLAIGPDGTPYVAYQDLVNGKQASVKKFDSTSGTWIGLGADGVSGDEASYLSLAIAPDGTLYMAYNDDSIYPSTNGLTVLQYDRTSDTWSVVGSPGFSGPAGAYWTSLAIDPSGTPYVAFMDTASNDKASVMKYDSASDAWAVVGSRGFSSGTAEYTAVAIAPDGTLYVAYRDDGNGYKATVKKYDTASNTWVDVGNPDFSTGEIGDISLAISPGGTPYVAYHDGQTRRGTIMRYEPTKHTWSEVGGAAGFSQAGSASFLCLTIASDGTPYVGFREKGSLTYRATVMKFVK